MSRKKGLYDLAIREKGESVFGIWQFTLNPNKWINNDALLSKFDHIEMFDYLNADCTGFSDQVLNLDPMLKGIYLFYIVPQTDCSSGKYLMYVGKSARGLKERIRHYFNEFKRLDQLVNEDKLDVIKASEFRPYVDVMFALLKEHIKVELYVYKDIEDADCDKYISELEGHIYQKYLPPLCRKTEGKLSEEDKIVNNLFN